MEQVLVERVVGRQARLDRRELARRIALVGDEEETGLDLAELVGAVVEVVAPPQDALCLARAPLRGLARRMWAAGSSRRTSTVSSSDAAAERSAAGLPATHELLLLTERRAIPLLDADANPAGDEIAASGHPRRAVTGRRQDVVAHLGRVCSIQVGCAVAKPHQVARRVPVGGRPAQKPGLEPAQRRGALSESGQIANSVKRDLRVIRARLDADVTARAGGVELVARERRQLGQGGGTLVGEPIATIEEPGAEAECQRHVRRSETLGFARVGGRRVLHRISVPETRARRHARSRGGPGPKEPA